MKRLQNYREGVFTPPARPRYLSEADCQDIAQRLAHYSKGGGKTQVILVSRWTGNIRWARNRIITSGEDRDCRVKLKRLIRGAQSYNNEVINDVSDTALVAAARRAERLLELDLERVDADVISRADSPVRQVDEPVAVPKLFFESTYQLDAERRAAAAHRLMQSAAAAGMASAGYLEVSATSMAQISSWGYVKYYEFTWAQYSVTVRDPTGIGSGWAGVDWPDWTKIDGDKLSAIALDKCLRSRNPVRVEPGRYTTILEPQAVCDFIGHLVFSSLVGSSLQRAATELTRGGTFTRQGGEEPPNIREGQVLGVSRLGEKVIDERISISADPMDPELGVPPYDNFFDNYDVAHYDAYHAVNWIEQGVLKHLAYNRTYGTVLLGEDLGLPNSGAFRMSVTGPTMSVDEMVATTKRGLLVTRFDAVDGPGGSSLLCRGYTRDGLWLIENGKISKPAQNMLFVESIMFALNKVEQLGVPQRVFHPLTRGTYQWIDRPQPMIAPPLKINDFSFTALSSAI